MLQAPKNFKQLRKLVQNKIVDHWQNIAIQLGITTAQIETIKGNHKELPVQECCRKMLFDWIESKQSKNPGESLIEAVDEVGRGFYAQMLRQG